MPFQLFKIYQNWLIDLIMTLKTREETLNTFFELKS